VIPWAGKPHIAKGAFTLWIGADVIINVGYDYDFVFKPLVGIDIGKADFVRLGGVLCKGEISGLYAIAQV
jgi:hypothetical protein